MVDSAITEAILHISGYPKDSIAEAIKRYFKSDDDKQKFQDGLTGIIGLLGQPSKKRKIGPQQPTATRPDKTPRRSSDAKIFEDNILPQIRQNIDKYEEQKGQAVDSVWATNLEFIEKFNNLQLIDLPCVKSVHKQIIHQEGTAMNLHVVVAFYRGQLYLNARKFMPPNIKVKEWYTSRGLSQKVVSTIF